MSNDWRTRVDEWEESDEKKRREKDKKERKKKWEETVAGQEERKKQEREKVRCHICGRPDAKWGDEDLRVQDFLDTAGPYREFSAFSRCKKCRQWACDDRRSESHLHKGVCKKCAEKPKWWPFYRWNPF